MIGIPLMFMCLTYTGDLLADAFISGYSKIVNCVYRLIFRGCLKSFLPAHARRNFEQPDVRNIFIRFSSHFSFSFHRPKQKTLDMSRSLQH